MIYARLQAKGLKDEDDFLITNFSINNANHVSQFFNNEKNEKSNVAVSEWVSSATRPMPSFVKCGKRQKKLVEIA